MARHLPSTEICIVLRTIPIAGVLAVLLVLACAGATGIGCNSGGAGVNYTSIQALVDAASDGAMIEVRSGT